MLSNHTPDAWIERQPDEDSTNYLCSGCGEYCCRCDEREDEQSLNDTVRCCPECETPNQFGELCERCRQAIESERTTN